MEDRRSPAERTHIERMTRISVVGSAATVRRGLEILIDATDAEELMLTGQIFDHAGRLRSFPIVAQVHETMAAERQPNAPMHQLDQSMTRRLGSYAGTPPSEAVMLAGSIVSSRKDHHARQSMKIMNCR